MQIAGYLKTSVIEWPGKISSVIFVPGCNFRCPFCHNADLVKNRGLKLIDVKEILKDLENRKKWIDGVAITGGEPTLQTDLSRFLDRLKEMGLRIMIETNGSQPKVVANVLVKYLVDYIAMDIKGPLDEYEKFVKVKSQKLKVKKSIELILKSKIDFEFRTTVVPGLHNKQILIKIASELNSLVKSSKLKVKSFHWYLQNFQPKNCLDSEFEKRKPFIKEELQGFLKAVKKIIPQTEIREV